MTTSGWKQIRHQTLLWLEAGLIDEAEYRCLMDHVDAQLIALRPDSNQRRTFTAKLLLRGGVSLVIAGIIYFLAANWRGFARGYKTAALLIGMTAAYTGGTYYLLRERADRAMGMLLVVAGSWLFGISLALIGQIYNSHADSWQLFTVWAVPCIAFSWLFSSFYFAVKSLLLLNFGVWMLLFPSTMVQLLTDGLQIGIISITIFNALFFVGISLRPRNWMRGARYIAYLAMLIFLFTLTFLDIGSEGTTTAWSLFYLIGLVAAVYCYIEVKLDEWLVYTTLCVGAIWTFAKFIELIFYNFLLLIFFGIIWLGVNAFVFSWINTQFRRKSAET